MARKDWDSGSDVEIPRRWWAPNLTVDEQCKAMIATVRYLRNEQQYRQRQNLFYAQLYGDLPLNGFGLAQYVRTAAASRVAFNVVQSNVDALHAKSIKVRPKNSFLTSGGDYEVRENGRQLEKWGDGLFYENKYWDAWGLSALHAGIWGDGFIKTTFNKKRKTVNFGTVYPFEITINESEALYGQPRNFFQQRFYDRSVLASKFPDSKDIIAEAPTVDYERDAYPEEAYFQFGRNEMLDQVLVTEAWHIPSDHGADDGVHMIGLPNGVLFSEAWEHDWVPFAKVQRMTPPSGYYGIGIPEQIAGIQMELNYLTKNISQSHHLLSKARVFIETSSKVPKSFFTNEIGTFVPYTGTMPQVIAPQSVSSDVYQYQRYLVEMANTMSGNPRMPGGDEKPHGVDSAKALRTLISLQSEFFIAFSRSLEEAACTSMRQAIAFARKLGSLKVKYSNSGTLETIDFRDIDLDEEAYVIKAFPTSMLSTIPAARMQEVDDMIRAGYIEQDYGAELLGFPDTEAYTRKKNAGRRLIERNLYLITAKGEWNPPEDNDNHELAMKLANETYNEARLDKVPQERLDMLQDYLDITSEKKSAQDMAQSAMGGQPMLNEQTPIGEPPPEQMS